MAARDDWTLDQHDNCTRHAKQKDRTKTIGYKTHEKLFSQIRCALSPKEDNSLLQNAILPDSMTFSTVSEKLQSDWGERCSAVIQGWQGQDKQVHNHVQRKTYRGKSRRQQMAGEEKRKQRVCPDTPHHVRAWDRHCKEKNAASSMNVDHAGRKAGDSRGLWQSFFHNGLHGAPSGHQQQPMARHINQTGTSYRARNTTAACRTAPFPAGT